MYLSLFSYCNSSLTYVFILSVTRKIQCQCVAFYPVLQTRSKLWVRFEHFIPNERKFFSHNIDTQPPVQWVPGLSRGKVLPGRDADPSPFSSAEV